METSMRMTPTQRQAVVTQARTSRDPRLRLRAHILLLLAEGSPWALSSAVLFCSPRTIARWQERVEGAGVAAVLAPSPLSQSPVVPWWQQGVAMWVTELTPQTCGFLRSRWCCALLVVLLVERGRIQGSAQPVRRWLHQEQLVWRRPRPVVGPTDAAREALLRDLRQLLATLPADEMAVFQDEVDLNPTPKRGALGMRRGHQGELPTPGTNDKRSLAGSLNWRTGAWLVTAGLPQQGRSAALFVRHLKEVRRQLRRYRKLHVSCDHARSHDCQLVWQYLAQWGHRRVLHYLPTYSPDPNPSERIWWHRHEESTRCHRCQTMEELLDMVFAWLQNRSPFAIEGSVYPQARAA